MRAKRLFCIVLSLILCLTLCTPALAEGDLLFVAVNDSIPLTLTALPYESSSGIYVPYTAFDASPGGVIPAYNAQAQTFVLFTRQRRLVFDLAEGIEHDVASCRISPVRASCPTRYRSAPMHSLREAEMIAFASAWTLRHSS